MHNNIYDMFKDKEDLLAGIISDTHGLLRPEAVNILQGSDIIIHAGDIGKEVVLDELETIAPVVAVRGNTDRDAWAHKLQKREILELNKTRICVLHDLSALDMDIAGGNIHVVVSGHTHMPSVSRHKSVLYVNPGSAGPKRLNLPVSVALLEITGKSLNARIKYLMA